MNGKPSQKGIALLTALVITALVASIAAVISVQAQRKTLTSLHSLQREQALMYALGAEDLARIRLSNDPYSDQVDHNEEQWATQNGEFEIDEGRISLYVQALDGKLNLNDLVQNGRPSAVQFKRVQRLLGHLNIPPTMTNVLLDWVDANAQRSPGGFEDDHYMQLDPPYRTANTPMRHLSELRLIEGFDPETYKLLAPHVTVLPANSELNLNMASNEVLASLVEGKTPADMQNLRDGRGNIAFEDTTAFFDNPVFKDIDFKKDRLSVQSQYFEVNTLVHLGETRLRLISLLQRNSKHQVQVLQRSLGSL